MERLRLARDGIASVDWSSYPGLRFSGGPDQIEAPALLNTLAQASGVRRLALPLLDH